jgi:GT2 family glycosyltransferase
MKILIGIPCLYGHGHTEDAIKSVVFHPNVDLLLIDNGAESDIKRLIKEYSGFGNTHVISNKENVYVNPAWNQIIDVFLKGDWDLLCIMNSDLTMQFNWADSLRNLYEKFGDDYTYIPVVKEDRNDIKIRVNPSEFNVFTVASAPGIFITLNRKQAKLIYPIPEDCKVWFGDDWIYGILRGLGCKTAVASNLIAYHGVSQTVQRVEGIDRVIANDKIAWEQILSPKMNEVINEQRNKGK